MSKNTASVQDLRGRLRAIDAITNEQWLHSLGERKRTELEFHDRHRDRAARQHVAHDTYEKLYGNERYYSTVARSRRYAAEWIERHSPGKVFLDYACGNGENAIRAAKAGATLAVGLDISRHSIENARRDAAAAGVSDNTFFVQADAEDTKLPHGCIDTVICSGMLHHLDLSFAFPELRRIMAPSGRLLAVEALDYNPAIKLYRRLTPDMRTDWEKAHILCLRDVEFARRFLVLGEIRYWHVTSYLAGRLRPLLPALDAADFVLTRIPFVQRLAWIFTFELIKPAP
jgi:ubiquinone/menaquinone biosynthesis C-methylase UbiE